ncbi:MAG: universal stress protein [Deltaproteobacteria bacterium]|nr:universal stress protein [Deltaproteobacteria bacterium]
MFTKMLIPLDGSRTAEKVLPYARAIGGFLKIPVELLAVVDIGEMALHITASKARYLDTMVDDAHRSSGEYLKGISAKATGVNIKWTVEKGRPEDVIIEKASADKNALIAMATHGRSGVNRWLLGSIAEKVLRGSENPLLLVRGGDELEAGEKVALNSVIVPLDGSELAEKVLPFVATLAKEMNLEVILFRAYGIPYSVYSGADGYAAVDFDKLMAGVRDEAVEYLEKKSEEVKKQGVKKVSYVTKEGMSADEIIALGRATPDNLIAMCSHGRSGVKRWMLGSVTETVVRHSGEPVLVVRAS